MASLKKKKSGGGGANWMDTYGDMVTLLLCFFVLLYSISSIDEQKWMWVVKSFNENAALNDDAPEGPEGEQNLGGGNDMPMTQNEINEVFDTLYEYIAEYAAQQDSASITVSEGDGMVFISFSDSLFFDGNRYALRKEGQAALDAILPALEQAAPYINEIRVLGHTATALSNTYNARKDRTLASNRANEVLVYLLEHSDVLDPARLISLGYGQWRPVAPNDVESERAKNRRVELIITGEDLEDALSDSVAQYYTETGQSQPGAEGELPADAPLPAVTQP